MLYSHLFPRTGFLFSGKNRKFVQVTSISDCIGRRPKKHKYSTHWRSKKGRTPSFRFLLQYYNTSLAFCTQVGINKMLQVNSVLIEWEYNATLETGDIFSNEPEEDDDV